MITETLEVPTRTLNPDDIVRQAEIIIKEEGKRISFGRVLQNLQLAGALLAWTNLAQWLVSKFGIPHAINHTLEEIDRDKDHPAHSRRRTDCPKWSGEVSSGVMDAKRVREILEQWGEDIRREGTAARGAWASNVFEDGWAKTWNTLQEDITDLMTDNNRVTNKTRRKRVQIPQRFTRYQ